MIWKMNDVAVRDGLELLMLMYQMINPVLVTSDSFQAPYRLVYVGLPTPGCASANFSTHGISYSQVCGRLRGYQVGQPDAFGPYVNDQRNPDLVIMDGRHWMHGVLISHGERQGHIWAYATGRQKVLST